MSLMSDEDIEREMERPHAKIENAKAQANGSRHSRATERGQEMIGAGFAHLLLGNAGRWQYSHGRQFAKQ